MGCTANSPSAPSPSPFIDRGMARFAEAFLEVNGILRGDMQPITSFVGAEREEACAPSELPADSRPEHGNS